ncbi:hypothetical protein [Candidatus Venteria ishoeyi]|uniref:Uncharacterized protein n=1 Tax=Candidatus Venteria ishoeyi TaxID=1899563 RepID=A0A1H6FF97_9GAMM|nr:hypothetical protein [Candidatus Venteria ishoeyi]SEH08758.1 Uncharacterised protein [Candidatus Venteria ishoeyi]
MLPLSQVSIICPCNDLESQRIIDIAAEHKLDVHEIQGGWGLTLEQALLQIANPQDLRAHIIIIELPGLNALNTLENLGKQCHIIDHHAYGAQQTTHHKDSSLEQFAQLIDYQMTTSDWEIAINDRDYLPGLSQAGVSLGRVCELRHAEHKIRAQAENMEQARQSLHRYVRDFDDLRLLLVPEKLSGVMLEAAQWPDEQDYRAAAQEQRAIELKAVLILYHADDDPENIRQIEYAGSNRLSRYFQAINHNARWHHDFQLWLGGGSWTCFWGAKPKHPGAQINELVTEILSFTLQTGRPLRHYNCTFYQPLDLFLDNELGNNAQPLPEPDGIDIELCRVKLQPDAAVIKQPPDLQAYLYFLPHLRDFIIEPADKQNTQAQIKPVKHWKLSPEKLAGMTLHLGKNQDVMESNICDLSLYAYFNGIYMLAIQVEIITQWPKTSSLNQDKPDWWHDLFYAPSETLKQIQARQIAKWLRFTNLARLLYPSFVEQITEDKIDKLSLLDGNTKIDAFALQDTDAHAPLGQMSPLLMHFLSYFFLANTLPGNLSQRLKSLPNDRMFVNVAYGLTGIAPESSRARERAEFLLSLAVYVDKANGFPASIADGYAYDRVFSQNLLQQQSLQRWNDMGIYSAYSTYANAQLGYGYFFNEIVGPTHIPFIYGRMFMLALFYQATLQHYNRHITCATVALSEQKNLDSFRELRKGFIQFTNNYWFREVTSQVQGIEIFDLQTRALDLNTEYELIKDEMERADEYNQALRDQIFNERAEKYSLVAFLVGLAAVIAAILALTDTSRLIASLVSIGLLLLIGYWFHRKRSKLRSQTR